MPDISSTTALTELTRENSRLRGDLLTVATRISHDLRTPLGSISTNADLLKEASVQTDPATTVLFNPIFQSTNDIARILERVSFVLKASLNPNPKSHLRMEDPVSVAVQRLERRMAAKKAVVTRPSSWPDVLGVSAWIETIWWNFLANALQHGKEPPRIELGWNETAGMHRFWVTDDGNGVPDHLRQNLFQPFHTLHKTNSTRGLGLSIVQRLTELQGGVCAYEHTPGITRFSFSLPTPGQSPARPKSS